MGSLTKCNGCGAGISLDAFSKAARPLFVLKFVMRGIEPAF